MFRLAVLIIGVVWASLLLLSWSGADDHALPAADAAVIQGRNF